MKQYKKDMMHAQKAPSTIIQHLGASLNDGIDDDLDKLEGTIEEIYNREIHQQLMTVDYS